MGKCKKQHAVSHGDTRDMLGLMLLAFTVTCCLREHSIFLEFSVSLPCIKGDLCLTGCCGWV
ncbi:unnamed protein product [Musa acuminata var. zebrina]